MCNSFVPLFGSSPPSALGFLDRTGPYWIVSARVAHKTPKVRDLRNTLTRLNLSFLHVMNCCAAVAFRCSFGVLKVLLRCWRTPRAGRSLVMTSMSGASRRPWTSRPNTRSSSWSRPTVPEARSCLVAGPLRRQRMFPPSGRVVLPRPKLFNIWWLTRRPLP